jgi:hypothetical protein
LSLNRQPIIQPVTVYGGFRIALVTWFLNRDEDWDCDYDFLSDTVYPTEAAAKAEIAKRFDHQAIRSGGRHERHGTRHRSPREVPDLQRVRAKDFSTSTKHGDFCSTPCRKNF